LPLTGAAVADVLDMAEDVEDDDVVVATLDVLRVELFGVVVVYTEVFMTVVNWPLLVSVICVGVVTTTTVEGEPDIEVVRASCCVVVEVDGVVFEVVVGVVIGSGLGVLDGVVMGSVDDVTGAVVDGVSVVVEEGGVVVVSGVDVVAGGGVLVVAGGLVDSIDEDCGLAD